MRARSEVTYRAGIVGCGRIGCGFDDDPRRKYVSTHAGAYARTAGIDLAALCDLDKGKLKRYGEKFQVRNQYTDFVQMLRQEQLDVLSICTLSGMHLEIARAAVECGVKAIFCEKPIADSLSAADEMIRLCAERGVVLMIDHQRRLDPFNQRIAAFVRDGGLGSVQQATCYYTAGVANTGTHLFDLLRFYVGDVDWVEGRISANASPNAADPNIDGWLGFANGTVAAIQACDVRAYTIFEINLLGTRGRLRVTSHGFEAEFEEVRESERYSGYRELFPASLPIDGNGSHEVMLCGVAHLLDCMERGRKPVSSGEDGRAALEVICGLSQSALECGRRVERPFVQALLTIASA
ncbi:MAG: Gfo/Idh/MocA family protein [Candidatus Acidiferrales bacterium]